MKRLLVLALLGTLASAAFAQSESKIPDYFGFYFLGIPDFVWVEGAQVQASFERVTGKLDMEHSNTPSFVSAGHEPIPLTFNQMSRLLLEAGSKDSFDMLGIEGTAKAPDGTAKKFFVVFSADLDHQVISLIPTAPSSSASDPKPNFGRRKGSGMGPPP